MTTTPSSPRSSRFAAFTSRLTPKQITAKLFVVYWGVSVAVVIAVAIFAGFVFAAGTPTQVAYTYSGKLYGALIVATVVLMVIPVILIIWKKLWKQLIALLIVLFLLVFTWQFLVFVFASAKMPGIARIVGFCGLMLLPVLIYFAGFQHRRRDSKLVELQNKITSTERVRDQHHTASQAATSALDTAQRAHKSARETVEGLERDQRVLAEQKAAAQKAHDAFLKSDTTVPPLRRKVETLRKVQSRLDERAQRAEQTYDRCDGSDPAKEDKLQKAWEEARDKAETHLIDELEPAQDDLTDAEDALASSPTADELNRLTDEEAQLRSQLDAARSDAKAKLEAKNLANTQSTNAATTLEKSTAEYNKAVDVHRRASFGNARGTVGYYALVVIGSEFVFALLTAWVAVNRL